MELNAKQSAIVEKVASMMKQGGINVMSRYKLSRELGLHLNAVQAALEMGCSIGTIVKISDDIYYTADVIEAIKNKLTIAFRDKPSYTTAELRDILQTSRKYVAPLLDYLDSIEFTINDGNSRRINRIYTQDL